MTGRASRSRRHFRKTNTSARSRAWAVALALRVLMLAATMSVCPLGNPLHAALADEHELVSVVIVSRHGVRSPIGGHPPLTTMTAESWPSWPVPPGHLTPRGADLARLLGVYYRDYYAAQGLVPAEGCPPPGVVLARADVDQRTRVTAQSLLEGMFPGCSIEPNYRADAKVDPLFHPTRAGTCRIDPVRARQSVRERLSRFAPLRVTFRAEFAAMQTALRCCTPDLCRAAGASASCGLSELVTTIAATNDGVRLAGPIPIASTAAEVFLLEYAQGFPDDQIAWGRASTPQAMRPLLRLHTLQFDLMQRTPYLAARQGSGLVDAILSALQRSVASRQPAPPKLTLLVGHDTNLSSIGGMLGLHWSLPSYVSDQTPPAGALHVGLLRNRQTGEHAVRLTYIAQTLDQMRRLTVLDRDNPPEQAPVKIDGCAGSDGGVCPWATFAALANRAIDRDCVAPSGMTSMP
jgi:4-phytase/acid phosphatase